MPYPRFHLVDAANGGFYHCTSRCVRRSWLCGADPVSGRSFEHRREWIESRLLVLAGVFAIDVYAYAVMSNHYHVVVHLDPGRTKAWSDEDVASRWLAAGTAAKRRTDALAWRALASDRARIAELRSRLGDLSWFMRLVNEPLARLANREDGVTGRFWEGRFGSAVLLDELALLACMAYVDLNPIRAGIAARVEDAANTSIHRRINHPETAEAAMAGLDCLGLTLSSYRALLTWTASNIDDDGDELASDPSARSALSPFGCDAGGWTDRVRANRGGSRALGAPDVLRAYAEAMGQRWIWAPRTNRTES